MENQSFIKYLFYKINSNLTFISKILLLLFSCSLFIPIPTGNINDLSIIQKLLTLYLGLASTFGLYATILLLACYIDFISDKPKENFHFKILFASIIIAPLISYMIYLIFNITTVIQILSLAPIIFLSILYAIDLGTGFTFDFTKIKKIFFKK